jgi:hypothetical protein
METPVNINDQQAKETLKMIQQTTEKTKKALTSYDSCKPDLHNHVHYWWIRFVGYCLVAE